MRCDQRCEHPPQRPRKRERNSDNTPPKVSLKLTFERIPFSYLRYPVAFFGWRPRSMFRRHLTDLAPIVRGPDAALSELVTARYPVSGSPQGFVASGSVRWCDAPHGRYPLPRLALSLRCQNKLQTPTRSTLKTVHSPSVAAKHLPGFALLVSVQQKSQRYPYPKTPLLRHGLDRPARLSDPCTHASMEAFLAGPLSHGRVSIRRIQSAGGQNGFWGRFPFFALQLLSRIFRGC